MSTANIIANPELTPQTVTIVPGLTLGRGATTDGNRVVFDATQNAQFASWNFSESPTQGHTIRVNVVAETVNGTLQVTTTGSDPQTIGTISAASVDPIPLDFVAFGTEDGVTIMNGFRAGPARVGIPGAGD